MKLRPNTRRWYTPGLGLKRWAALCGVAIALIIIGLWSVVNNQTAKSLVVSFVNFLQRSIPDLSVGQGLICVVVGILAAAFAGRHFNDQYSKITKGHSPVDAYLHDAELASGPKIVVIGGGTGLSVILKGLKRYTSNLTAVVSVGDDGGSSGRLRREFGGIPVGDIRSCIVALADEEDVMEQLFNYRFARGEGLKGHSLGNLMMVALTNINGNFQEAIGSVDQILHLGGKVLPVTMEPLELEAALVDGTVIKGECNIGETEVPIRHLMVNPPYAEVLPGVLEAIEEADAVILGPGSLYTSVIPNLCVHQMVDAIKDSSCKTFYICNVTTQPGETSDYTASDHLQAIYDHSCPEMIDYMLVDDGKTKPTIELADILLQASVRVQVDYDNLDKMDTKVIETSLVSEENPYHHDSRKLARTILRTLYSDKDFRLRSGPVKHFQNMKRLREMEEWH